MAVSYNMLFAGFGGQGILFTGKAVAYSGMMEGREVSWLPSYGPEMRGGTANCSVCLSDEPIGSPLVLNPDCLVAMNNPSYDKFIGSVVPGGVAVIDSTLVDRVCERTDITAVFLPATQTAQENGLQGLANIILLGVLLKKTGFTTPESLETCFRKIIPAKKADLIEKNMQALRLGMEFAG